MCVCARVRGETREREALTVASVPRPPCEGSGGSGGPACRSGARNARVAQCSRCAAFSLAVMRSPPRAPTADKAQRVARGGLHPLELSPLAHRQRAPLSGGLDFGSNLNIRYRVEEVHIYIKLTASA